MNLREPTAVNYRGERLSVRLGIVLSGVTFLLFIGYAFDEPRLGWVALGVVAVFLAGLYDDARPARTRGMRRQLAALRHGDVTPGAVKLAVIGAASAFTTWMLGGRGWTFLVGAAVIAGSANLWNLLDVRPGRALKVFLPVAVAFAAAAGWPLGAAYAGLAAAGAVGLWADLTERSMLGDCGANVLGFVVGVGTFLVLLLGWLAVVLAAIVVLHVLADTITLSRLIDATPPLRAVDRLGRRKFAENG